MTDFSPGKTNAGSGENKTNFLASHVEPTQQSPNPDDDQVVLEIDGRQYTRSALVTKVTHSDQHIQKLEQEARQNAELLARVNKVLDGQVSMTEVLQRLQQGATVTPTPKSNDGTENTQTPAPTAEAVVKLVREQLQQEGVASEREKNWQQVTETLTKQYGSKVNEQVAKIASENGLSLEEAAEMARAKPVLFLKLFPKQSASSSTTVTGNVNSQAFKAPPSTGKSGYWEARTTRDQTRAYLEKLEAKLA